MKIKSLLGRFIPSSSKTFHDKINELKSEIARLFRFIKDANDKTIKIYKNNQDKTAKLINENNRLVKENNRLVKENKNFIRETHNEIIKNLKPIENYIKQNIKPIPLYNNQNKGFDIGLVSSFMDYRKQENFEEMYLKLISGLDAESRKTVTHIHRRMELVVEGVKNIFTMEEQERLKYFSEHMGRNIFKLSDECFCMDEYMLPINNFLRSVFFDHCGIKQIQNHEKIRDKHIIDAGAYIGDSMLVFSKYTHKKVHCFEAMSENYKLIEKTILMNEVQNAVAINAGVGEKAGKEKFEFLDRGTGSKPSEQGTEEVEIVALDDYVEKHNLDIGLIKIDIEGAEQYCLNGAIKTITKQKPTLLISIYHNPEQFYNIKPYLESLNLGYTFKIYKPAMGVILVETVLIAEVL